MAKRLKHQVVYKLKELFGEKYIFPASSLNVFVNKENNHFSLLLHLNEPKQCEEVKQAFLNERSCGFIKNIEEHDSKTNLGVNITIDSKYFIKNIIDDLVNPANIGKEKSQRKIIEFSSPNIAKPFHAGHLRSTIIGNFLSNINKYLNDNVIKLNYLGDWGTQFGMLKVGVDTFKYTDEDIRNNPIQMLYEAYVKANELAETDTSINAKAREVFSSLESGDTENLSKWSQYRDFTMDELKMIYNRLGIVFDEYHWESMYDSKTIKNIMNDLQSKKIVRDDDVGRKVATVNERIIVVEKSDGSSLYLTRDIAAAMDRFEKYSFDEMMYVVDNSQTDHFNALFGILDQAKAPFVNRCKHVKFGRIRGMSTRKGSAVFLKDILDEAKFKMHRQQDESLTTKVSDERVSDVLGMSAVIINDLKQRRQKDYQFTWANALQANGDSGIRLQYTHCRIWSIEQNSGIDIPKKCCPEYFKEPEAFMLIQELARFDDVVEQSRKEMEACILVIYLFKLSALVNKAIKVMQVKDQEKNLAGQRLLLFHVSRLVMKRGLKILGVTPLNQM